MQTGLFDRNGNQIRVGDKVRLILDTGEERIFDVCFKTVQRTVKCHPDFDDEFAKVNITGVVFCWMGYDLFPCIDENGVPDNEKMEIVESAKQDERLMCKFDGQNVPRGMCGFDRESDTEPDDCDDCEETCRQHDGNCDKCPIQRVFDKCAEYEERERMREM